MYFLRTQKYCAVLNIDHTNLNELSLKDAYLESCKRYHPDLTPNTNVNKFVEIEESYRILKDYLKNKDISEDNEELVCSDGKRAQHRHYLSYDGKGYGTPSTRLKQYQSERLNKATEAVHEFQVQRIKSNTDEKSALILRDSNLQREIKIKKGFERLVEDLIQESIARGDFENLPGYGKPLKYRPEIPYVDSTTYKLNEILANNGYIPEWVTLEKEIREERNALRQYLCIKSVKEMILNTDIRIMESKLSEEIKAKVKKLNNKIDKYNTLVPIFTKQQIHFIMKNEMNKVKNMPNDNNDEVNAKNDNHLNNSTQSKANVDTNNTSILGLFIALFQ